MILHAREVRALQGSALVPSHLLWKRHSRPILMLRDSVVSSEGLGEKQAAGGGVLAVL